jgi:hypothetical protein
MPGSYVTNNPMVREKAALNGITDRLVYINDGFMNVLTAARDLIHKGHRLLTHPLSGSVKPGETPYKTVILSKDAGELDSDSLRIIEECILTARKLGTGKKQLNEQVLRDFQLIDYTLIFGKLSK